MHWDVLLTAWVMAYIMAFAAFLFDSWPTLFVALSLFPAALLYECWRDERKKAGQRNWPRD